MVCELAWVHKPRVDVCAWKHTPEIYSSTLCKSKNRKYRKCQSVVEWINLLWYVHVMISYKAKSIEITSTMFSEKKSQRRLHYDTILIYIETQTETTKWHFVVIKS